MYDSSKLFCSYRREDGVHVKKVENEDWGQPVFESFIRDYVDNKPDEERLFALEKELYGALMKK